MQATLVEATPLRIGRQVRHRLRRPVARARSSQRAEPSDASLFRRHTHRRNSARYTPWARRARSSPALRASRPSTTCTSTLPCIKACALMCRCSRLAASRPRWTFTSGVYCVVRGTVQMDQSLTTREYGSWPTTIVHDALLQPDQLNPRARFVLPPSRLFNERLHIMLVGRGDTWVEYALSANTAPNTLLALLLLLALGVVAGAVVLFVRIRQGVRFLEPDEHIHKVAGARHASMP
eukprot:6577169-Prymnesium_polylepis.1